MMDCLFEQKREKLSFTKKEKLFLLESVRSLQETGIDTNTKREWDLLEKIEHKLIKNLQSYN